MNEEQYRYLFDAYQQQPDIFTRGQVDTLKQNAERLGLPFAETDQDREFSMARTLSQLGSGFLSGFTTIQASENEPQNTAEAIARSVGNLLGFVGYVPGPGLAGRLAVSSVGRALGLAKHGAKLAGYPSRLTVHSVPMYVADKVVRGVERMTPEGHVLKFLGERGVDIAREGAQLGVASAVSSWQQGVDGMAQGLLLGAAEGAGFRAIGNFVNVGSRGANRALRATANAIYAGLPTTLAGDPTEMQVYQYLLGAYFGVVDAPLHERRAAQWMDKNINGVNDVTERSLRRLAPHRVEGFKDLPQDVQDEILQDTTAFAGKMFSLGGGEEFTTGTAVTAKALRDAMGDLGEGSDLFVSAMSRWRDVYTETLQRTGDSEEALRTASEKSAESLTQMEAIIAQVKQAGTSPRNEGVDLAGLALEDLEPVASFERPLRMMARGMESPQNFLLGARSVMADYAARLSEGVIDDGPELMDRIATDIAALDGRGKKVLNDRESRNLLRQTLRSYVGRIPRKQVWYTEDGVLRTDTTTLGRKDLNDFVHPSQVQKTLEGMGLSPVSAKVRSLRSEETGRYEDYSIFDERNEVPFADFVRNNVVTDKNGNQRYGFLFGGVKDKGEVLLSSWAPERFAPTGAKSTLSLARPDEVTQFVQDRMVRMGDETYEHYETLRSEFVEQFEEGEMLGGLTPEQYYDANVLHNQTIVEQLNGGVSIEEMVSGRDGKKGHFITDPFALNKRLQLFNDGAAPASPRFYSDLEFGDSTLGERGGIPFVLVNDLRIKENEDGTRQVDLPSGDGVVPVMLKGRKGLFASDTKTDGALMMSGRLFDRILGDAGLDQDTGAVKASLVYDKELGADGQPLGAMLGKFAIFRLDDEASAKLEESGAMMMVYNSAAKQRGFRDIHNVYYSDATGLQFTQTGVTDRRRATKPQVYTAPFEGLKINHASSEQLAHATHGADIPLQAHSVIDDPAAIDAFYRNRIVPSIDGDKTATTRYLSGDLKDFSLDKFGVREALSTLFPEKGQYNRDLWRATMSEILFKEAYKPDAEGDLDVHEIEIAEPSGTAGRILDALRGDPELLTPEVLHLDASLHRYALAQVRKWAVNRATKPFVEEGGTAILTPNDVFMQQSLRKRGAEVTQAWGKKVGDSVSRGVVPEGHVMFNEALRGKEIKWLNGTRVTLNEAWDAFKTERNKDKKNDMARLLTFSVVRVPADSKSGVRRLRFAGFTGRKGAGLLTHDLEERSLGGADHDIDKAFWFQDLTNNGTGYGEVERFFERKDTRDQWLDKDGVFIEPKITTEDTFIAKRPAHQSGVAAMFDPTIQYDTARSAYQGNRTIGIPALATRRVNAIWRQIRGGEIEGGMSSRQLAEIDGVLGGTTKVYMRSMDYTEEAPLFRARFKGYVGKDRDRFFTVVRDALNHAADSSNAPLKLGSDGVNAEIAKSLIRRGEIELFWLDQRQPTFVDDNGVERLNYMNVTKALRPNARRKLPPELKDTFRQINELVQSYEPTLRDYKPFRPLYAMDSGTRRRGGDGKERDIFDMLALIGRGAEMDVDSTWYRALQSVERDVRVEPVGKGLDGRDIPYDKMVYDAESQTMRIADPSFVFPFIDSDRLNRAISEVAPTVEAARDPNHPNHAEAELDWFLSGRIVEPRPRSFNFDDPYKVRNDAQDVIALRVLPLLGRDALREITDAGDDGRGVIAAMQKAYFTPTRIVKDPRKAGFRQRVLAAMKMDDSVETGESVDQVFAEMSRYADGLEENYGIATRRYFEALVTSSAQPMPMSPKEVARRSGQIFRSHLNDPNDKSGLQRRVYAETQRRLAREAKKEGKERASTPFKQMEEAVIDDLRKEWMNRAVKQIQSTRQASPMYMWDGVSDATIRMWAGATNEVFRAPKPKFEETFFSPIEDGVAGLRDTADPETLRGITEGTTPDTYLQDVQTWTPKAQDNQERVLRMLFKDAEAVIAKAEEGGAFDSAEVRELTEEMTKILKRHPEMIPVFDEVLSGELQSLRGVAKSADIIELDDIRAFVAFHKRVVEGGAIDKIFGGKDESLRVPKLASIFFPDYVGNNARHKGDFHVSKPILTRVLTPDGLVERPVRKVFSTFAEMKDYFDNAVKQVDRMETASNRAFDTLMSWLDTTGTKEDASELFNTATVMRQTADLWELDEKGNPVLDKDGNKYIPDAKYKTEKWRRWKQMEKIYSRLKDKKYTLPLPKITGVDKDGVPTVARDENRKVVLQKATRTGKELMGTLNDPNSGIINAMLTVHFEDIARKWIRDDKLALRTLTFEGYKRGDLALSEVEDINSLNLDYHATMDYLRTRYRRTQRLPHLTHDMAHRIAYEHQLRYDANVEIGDVSASIEKHLVDGRIDQEGYQKVLGFLRDRYPFAYKDADIYEMAEGETGWYVRRKDRGVRAGERGLRKFPFYFPQLGHDRKAMEGAITNIREKLERGDYDGAERTKMEAFLAQQYAKGVFPDEVFGSKIRDLSIRERHKINALSDESDFYVVTPANLRARGDVDLPGWRMDEGAVYQYNRSVVKGLHDLVASLLARDSLKRFENEGVMQDFTPEWVGWGERYLNSFLGTNTMYSDAMLRGDAKVRSSASYYTSDRGAWDLYKKIHSKIKGDTWHRIKDAEWDSPEATRFANQVRRVSFLEGRWNLMTLLANTRSMFNNLYGGTAMTMVSTGFRPWMRTFQSSHWRSINPEWTSWDKVRDFAERSGAVESYIRTEVNLQGRAWETQNAKRFLEDAVRLFKKNPNAGDSELQAIAKRHQLGEDFVDTAAWFMRKVERDLRMRSFMAHYFKAREVWGASAEIIPHDDPTLIEMARRGVEGTQFLYHSSARPLASSSSIGKIFSRFQTWSWNSIRFRRDVIKQAKTLGFRPGTEEFARFRRTAQGDLFMFALAAAFPFSMFEAALPAPMNYVEDLSAFFFGDEDEKERAFFGVMPYPLNVTGIVMPPSSRIFTAMMNLAGGDIDRFVDYHMYTMIPFGMTARNIKKSIENPFYLVESNTGFPLHKIGTQVFRERKRESDSFFAPDKIGSLPED